MTKTLRRILIVVFVIVVAVGLVLYFTRKKPVDVLLETVEYGRVESVVSNTRAGTVKACRRANLAPATGGQIARLYVSEGDRVKAGKVLIEIWNKDLSAQVKLAESETAAAVAKAEEACLLAEVSNREAKRLVELFKNGLASDDKVDRAVTNAKALEAACRAAQEGSKVSAARIDVAQATLERTILKAPFDGSVAEVNGEVGEFITPSPPGIPTPPAVDLIDTSCLFISAPIDEIDALSIKTGMPVRISLDALPGKYFQGKVKRIAPYVLEIEKQARTVDVEADFKNKQEYEKLIPGYSADLEIILEVHDNVLRLPTEAVLEGNRVLLYQSSDSLLKERSIKTGLSNWKFTEVLSGLTAGDQIVISVDRKGVASGSYVRPGKKTSPENYYK